MAEHHIPSTDGIKPQPKTLELLWDLLIPTSDQSVWSVVSQLTAFGDFHPLLAITSEPLSQDGFKWIPVGQPLSSPGACQQRVPGISGVQSSLPSCPVGFLGGQSQRPSLPSIVFLAPSQAAGLHLPAEGKESQVNRVKSVLNGDFSSQSKCRERQQSWVQPHQSDSCQVQVSRTSSNLLGVSSFRRGGG